jgi:hypothetical protein
MITDKTGFYLEKEPFMKSTVRKITLLFLCMSLCVASLLGCANQMERPVAKAAGYDVRFEELRFVIMTKKAEFRGTYGEDLFDTPEKLAAHRAEFEAAVIETLKENYIVLAACNHYLPDLKITDKTITDAVDAMMEETIADMGGEDAFNEYAKARYMTKNLMRFTLAVYAMETRLLEELAARGEFFTDDQEDEFFNWIRQGNGAYVQHLFIRNDEGDSIEENRARAEEARTLLSTGQKNINSLVGNSRYNEDPFNTAPYYLIRGVYDEIMEKTALALSEAGAMSEVVETEEGFYVFVRLNDTDDQLRGQIASLLSSYQWANTERIKEGFRDSVTFEWLEELDYLTVE